MAKWIAAAMLLLSVTLVGCIQPPQEKGDCITLEEKVLDSVVVQPDEAGGYTDKGYTCMPYE